MQTPFHETFRELWKNVVEHEISYRGLHLEDDWIKRMESVMPKLAGSGMTDSLHREIVKFYSNVDDHSLVHLWYNCGNIDSQDMHIANSRRLVSHILNLRGFRLDRINFTTVFEEFLVYLNADPESGAIVYDDFIRFFPIWYVSRQWRVDSGETNETPILQIIRAWDTLDISDSGLISRRSMEKILLPYAFRVLYPDTASDTLRDRWIRLMIRVFDCTQASWVNHWMTFMFLDPLKFKDDDVPTGSSPKKVTSFVEDALTYFGLFPMSEEDFAGHVSDYLVLINQTTSSVESRSRAAALWITSRVARINHQFLPPTLAEKHLPREPILTDINVLQNSLANIWSTYFPPSAEDVNDGHTIIQHSAHFDRWASRIIASLNRATRPRQLLVLRKHLCAQFISQLEVETLWDNYVGRKSTRIPPHKIIRLLHALYFEIYSDQQLSEGNWVIREWLEDISALALLIHDNRPDIIITKDVFLIVFPLWYASISPAIQTEYEGSIESVWPGSSGNRIIFSEPVLREFLTKMWDTLMPADIGLPCQEWWLVRCCNRLARMSNCQGVTRNLFASIFFHIDEVNYIYNHYQIMNSNNLIELLHNCLDQDQYPVFPTEFAEEFFLVADSPPPQNGGGEFILPHSTFIYAFPLWAAAHAN